MYHTEIQSWLIYSKTLWVEIQKPWCLWIYLQQNLIWTNLLIHLGLQLKLINVILELLLNRSKSEWIYILILLVQYKFITYNAFLNLIKFNILLLLIYLLHFQFCIKKPSVLYEDSKVSIKYVQINISILILNVLYL